MNREFSPHEISWTQGKIAHLWGYYSKNQSYNAQYFSYHSGGAILNFVLKHISVNHRRVLDFGCGPGFMIEHLLKKGIPCEGLEFSTESVEAVNNKFTGHPLFRGVIAAKDLPVPYEDKSIDVVFIIEVIEHLLEEQLIPTIQDIFRILRPGGHVIITIPSEENLEANKVICPECGCIYHRWQHLRSFSAKSLTSIMNSNGFSTIIDLSTAFGPPLPLDPIRRIYRFLRKSTVKSPNLIYIGQKDKAI